MKGKKKKQATAASKQTSDKKSQEQSLQQQQEEQEQTSSELSSSSTQQKTIKGKEQEATASTSKQTSDKKSQKSSQQQQEKWEQISSEALPGSSKQQKVPKDPKQQQVIRDQPQQQPQGAWSRPRPQSQPQQQQTPQILSQQQPQGAWGQPQGAWSRPLQQVPQDQPQGAWSRPRQQPQSQLQQQQETWSHPSQQTPQSPPQQQPQGAWGQSQQQLQGAWSRPLQQVSQSQPQQQQSQPQRTISRGQLPQQQQPPAWSSQQRAWEQQQQHRAPTLLQQQQKALFDTDAAGDHRQAPSTSTTSLDVSELALTDPFHKEKTEKTKMSSKQLKLYHDMIPKRKNPLSAGKIGINITVFTNMYQILFNDKFVTNAVHYDIDIHPFEEKRSKTETKKETRLPKILCRDIFEQCRNKHFSKRFPAYDGNKNAYSANDLPFSDYMQDVFWFLNDRGQRKQYEIILKKVAYIDLSWIKNLKPGLAENRDQTAVQVLDVIMRHAPESRFINVGRSLYWNIDRIEPLGGGLTLGHGGFLSGVLGWQPYLNVDVAHKGFTMNLRVLEYIADCTQVKEEELSYNDVVRHKNKILSFLKGLKVTYAIPNSPISKRTYRVLDLWLDSCDSHTFTSSDVTYTITRYFREIKRYNIKRTDLPTLHVGKTSNGGKVLVPLELCTIVGGQAVNKMLDERQTTNMIKKAATAAPLRKQNIEEAFRKLEINRSSVMEKEFHLSVSSQMKTVDARVLPPPGLKYANSTTTVEKGVWRLQKFNQAKNLGANSWTILILVNRVRDDDIQSFVIELQNNAKIVGMSIGTPEKPYRKFETKDLRGITNYFNQHKHLQLIIVVVPDYTDVTYGNVKKITEMDVGVLTQCIKYKTLRSCNAAILKNLLQKINSKLNGINHILDKMPSCLSNYPCVLVGADVTHPAPDSKSVPSIAAVAASRNNSTFQYNVTLRLQPPKEEMILDLEAIILSQLNIYYQETKSPPRRLIYYRDGVGEGQLPQVLFYEINAIKNAIKTFNKGNIEVTCMVVQKRHHVRLFPTNRYESDDRNGNVRAGTIVDTTITHPDHIDFYLVSHASIQGTARPTKYRCICNDSKFNEDQLEEMTYFLCHMYARCTRSVSYPAPTYYAHLAAFRGRALLQGNPNFNLADLEKEQRNFKMKMGKSPMYFV